MAIARAPVLLALLLATAPAPDAREMTLEIVGDDGSALAGAHAWPVGTDLHSASATDAEGRATLEIPDEVAALCATAPGHALERVALAAEADSAFALLSPTGHARLRALGDARQPLAGAAVRAAAWPSDCDLRVETGGDGTVTIDHVPPGRALVRVEAAGHLPREIRVDVADGPPPPEPRSIEPVELVLRPAVTLHVRAVDAKGEPVAGARASLLTTPSEIAIDPPLDADERRLIESLGRTGGEAKEDSKDIRTDASGRLALPAIPRATTWTVGVEHEAHAPRVVELPGDREEARAAVSLSPGAAFRLRAVDAGGLTWARPRVTPRWLGARAARDATLLELPLVGAADGTLRADRLPAGPVVLEVTAAGARPRLVRGVALEDGKLTEVGDVVLEAGATLAGHVESSAGSPIEGATISAQSWIGGRQVTFEATSDARGAFRVEGLDPSEDASVTVEAEGHRNERVGDVAPDRRDLLVTLEPAATLRVTILDERTGEPAPDARAAVRAGDARSFSRREHADEAGVAVFDDLPEGLVGVRAQAEGLATRVVEDIELRASEVIEREVRLGPGWALEGRVLDPEQRPVGGARVTVDDVHGGRSSTTSASDGRFSVDGLAGVVDVLAEHPLHREVRRTALTEADAGGGVELVLGGSGAVAGRVLAEDGSPLAGALVRGGGRRAIADAEGRYRLDGLEPGVLALTKTDRPGTTDGWEEARVSVARGELTRHDFGSGGRVHGLVTLGDEPVEGARLSLTPWTLEGRSAGELAGSHAVSDVRGEYSLAGLEPGGHVLHVQYRDRSFARDVTLPETPRHRLDVPIPELVVSGRVTRADDGSPVGGARVTATPRRSPEDSAGRMFSKRVMHGDDGVIVTLTTSPQAETTTRTDGTFELVVGESGPHAIRASAWGSDLHQEEPLELDVAGPIDGLVIELAPKEPEDRAELVVEVRDATTGAAVHGGRARLKTGNGGSSMLQGFRDGLTTFRNIASGEHSLLVWAETRAPAKETIDFDAEDPRPVTVALDRGGTLRLLVPPTASLSPAPFGALGGIALVAADGTDLAQAMGPALADTASVEEPGRWLLRDLPPGPLRVELPGGAAGAIDVVADETVELDLR